VRVDGFERRLQRGDVAVVRSGQWHELVNDTSSSVEIFVIQVSNGTANSA
jgi:quercetin dioxygenase-like cupin family protein